MPPSAYAAIIIFVVVTLVIMLVSDWGDGDSDGFTDNWLDTTTGDDDDSA